MTYLQVLLWLVAPAASVAALWARGGRALGTRGPWAVPVLASIAFLWTTPWDNVLVWRGVWSYGPDRVLGTFGWVPWEEYAFFLLQPTFTGFLFLGCLRRTGAADSFRPASPGIRTPVAAGFGVLTLMGAALLLAEPTLYLGLILVWAAPVLAGMWAYRGDWLQGLLRPALGTAGLATVYLCAVDRIAIARGVWTLSPRYTVGWAPLGLPIEEAIFFLVTNLLVVWGLLLLLVPGWPAPRGHGPVPDGARRPPHPRGRA